MTATIATPYVGHPMTLCERRGHDYHLGAGVWTCSQCADQVGRDCRAGCPFAMAGVNCVDVIGCAASR